MPNSALWHSCRQMSHVLCICWDRDNKILRNSRYIHQDSNVTFRRMGGSAWDANTHFLIRAIPLCCNNKAKWSRYRPGVAQRVGRGTALLFHDRGTRRGCVVGSTPRPHFSPEKTRYTLYRRLRGPQGRSGRTENLVPTGIRSRTVQPVVSRYTDWATGPIVL